MDFGVRVACGLVFAGCVTRVVAVVLFLLSCVVCFDGLFVAGMLVVGFGVFVGCFGGGFLWFVLVSLVFGGVRARLCVCGLGVWRLRLWLIVVLRFGVLCWCFGFLGLVVVSLWFRCGWFGGLGFCCVAYVIVVGVI